MVVNIDGMNTPPTHYEATKGFTCLEVALFIKLVRSYLASTFEADEILTNEQMPNVVWREWHWTQAPQSLVVFVPMKVKCLHGVGCPAFCEEERLMIAQI